jgi:hypothetical protein
VRLCVFQAFSARPDGPHSLSAVADVVGDLSVIAEQLGHKDGGKLVEQLYGHPDRKRRLAKIRDPIRHDRILTWLRVGGDQALGTK